MNLKEYQKKAVTTAAFDRSVAIPYLILGMVGETAELYEKVDQYRDELTTKDLFIKEFGDVAWYLAVFCEKNGLELTQVIKLGKASEEESRSYEQLKNDLVLYSGQIAEIAKKILRDNFEEISDGVYPKDKLPKISVPMSNLFETLKRLAFYFMFDFDEILEENIKKLQSRKKRDKIKGSGDNR